MGQYLFLLIAGIFVIQIIKRPATEKLIWFFTGILIFPQDIEFITSPSVTFPRLLIYTLLIVSYYQNKQFWLEFKNFPLRRSLLPLLILLLITGLADERLSLFYKVYRPLTYFFDRFFVIFLVFINVRSIPDLFRIYRNIFRIFILMSIYGMITYMLKTNPYADFINTAFGGTGLANVYMESGMERFRISSFAWHAIYYGLLLAINVLMLTFYISFVKEGSRSAWLLWTTMLLTLVNLILVNSRTPVLSLGIGLGIFYLFAFTLKGKFKLALMGLLVLTSTYFFLPSSLNIVDQTIKTFTSKGAEVSGSSLEMREIQFAASWLIFQKSPVTGNGFNYINEDLGYNRDEKLNVSDKDFAGFESYIYVLLIEQGLCGIIGTVMYFASIIIFHVKLRKGIGFVGKKLIYLNIAITVAYFLFILGTGELGSLFYFNCIVGLNLGGIILLKNQFNKAVPLIVPHST